MIRWKVGIYLRLSIDDGEKKESNSIANQRAMIQNYLTTEEEIDITDFYIDDGYSGTNFDRPGFKRLLNDIITGKINTVIVKDLSRFGRNYIETGYYFENMFPTYNIRFIAINDNIDSERNPNSLSDMVVPMKNLMNEQYAKDVSMKVRSVLDIKKKNGQFIGTSAPYGYIKSNKNKYNFVIDNYASSVVKKIFTMALDGKSRVEIAEELNKNLILTPVEYKKETQNINYKKFDSSNTWKRETVDRILCNTSYIGELVQGKRKQISHKIKKTIHTKENEWIIIPNHHEAIISNEDFELVQNKIYNTETKILKDCSLDIFAGILECGECKNNFVKKNNAKSWNYYCSSYYRKKMCSKHRISIEDLESKVLKIINKQIELFLNTDNILEKVNDNITNYDCYILKKDKVKIEDKIIKYQKLIKDIDDDFENNILSKTDYDEYVKEYRKRLDKLNKQLLKINDNIKQDNNYRIEKFKSHMEEIKSFRNLERLNRKCTEELIKKIIIYENGNIIIKFRYQNEYLSLLDFKK